MSRDPKKIVIDGGLLMQMFTKKMVARLNLENLQLSTLQCFLAENSATFSNCFPIFLSTKALHHKKFDQLKALKASGSLGADSRIEMYRKWCVCLVGVLLMNVSRYLRDCEKG